jgi:hypothetical protein
MDAAKFLRPGAQAIVMRLREGSPKADARNFAARTSQGISLV